MPDNIDSEVNAIKAVLKALESLSPDARQSVIGYVSKRLGIALVRSVEPVRSNVGQTNISFDRLPDSTIVHLEEFTKQKNPKSANEMAAIVAYYLAELAPVISRKNAVTTEDLKTYFKIGGFPLPAKLRFTLGNAKNAGYFDAIGDGEYQLNAVGHNLVAHSLPRNASGAPRANRKRKAKQKVKSKR